MIVKRIRMAAEDADGDPGDPSTPVTLTGCLVAPRTSSTVDPDGRAGAVIGLTLYHRDPDLDVLRSDVFEINGDPERYRVEGEIGRWHHGLSGRPGGVEIALVRGEG